MTEKITDPAFESELRDVTLAILAGGRGTRMGMPKAHLQIAGRPILEWTLQHFQWPGPTMLVTAPAVMDPPGAGLFHRRAVDPVDDLGPLRGIATALEDASTDTVAVVTVDMPGVSRDVLKWLLKVLADRPTLVGLMCKRRVDRREFVEPFPAVFRRSALDILRGRLQSGELSVQRLCDGERIASIASSEAWPESIWANLNHPAELAAFEADMRKGGDRHKA